MVSARLQGRLGGVLAVWVSGVLRWRWLVIALFGALSLASFRYTAAHLGINTDTADMISPHLAWRQDFIDYRESFPSRYRVVLAVVDAPTAGQAERAAIALAERLAARSDAFQSVFYPGNEPFLQRNGLLYLEPDVLDALADRLAQVQPLLGRLQARFSAEQLIAVLDEALERADPAGREALAPLLTELTRTVADQDYEFDWRGLLASADLTPSSQVIIVEPRLQFDRVQPARRAMEVLRGEIAALPVSGAVVSLTGTVAMEHEELASVTAGAALAGLLALLMVSAVLYLALRSLALLAVTVTTLLVGLLGTAAFAAASIGHLNLISVAFAVLYIGLGVDFVIHWTLRFQELRGQGLAVKDALPATARGVGTSLVICAVTTAAGFYSFIPTPFEGVSELGLISGTGMFISLFVSVTLLPALLYVVAPVAPARLPVRWLGAELLTPLVSRPARVVAVALLLGLAALALLPGVRFDNNPLNLRDPDAESVRSFKALLAGMREPPLSLALLADPGHSAAAAEQAAALPSVRAVRTLADLVPSEQEAKLFTLEDVDVLLGPDFAELTPDPNASPAGLKAALARLADRLAALPGASAGERELAAALATPPPHDDGLYLNALARRLTAGLPYELTRLAAGLGAEPFTRQQLPAALADRWRAADGRELVEIYPADDITDNRAAASFLADVRSQLPRATGLPVVHHEAGATVVESFKLAFIYALVMIAALLWALLQNIRDALLVLAPIVLGALITAALTVLAGIAFNFANIIALPLLLGVGVDNGVHMVHRARTEPVAGGALATSTSRAVLFSGLTTLASFGNLGFSPHPGMASMGQLLGIGMALTLAATLVLLPALLRLKR